MSGADASYAAQDTRPLASARHLPALGSCSGPAASTEKSLIGSFVRKTRLLRKCRKRPYSRQETGIFGRKGVQNAIDDFVKPIQVQLSAAEIDRRREAVSQAAANARLEGQLSSPESEAIFDRFIQGELEIGDVIGLLKERHGLR